MSRVLYVRASDEVHAAVTRIADEARAPMSTVIDGLLRMALDMPPAHRVALSAAIANNQWKDEANDPASTCSA